MSHESQRALKEHSCYPVADDIKETTLHVYLQCFHFQNVTRHIFQKSNSYEILHGGAWFDEIWCTRPDKEILICWAKKNNSTDLNFKSNLVYILNKPISIELDRKWSCIAIVWRRADFDFGLTSWVCRDIKG